MEVEIRTMTAEDYRAVRALWERTPGIGLNESDEPDAVAAFLARNPDLSVVARAGGSIVGAVLGGHDGRRGYLHHLAVSEPHRDQGIAREMLAVCAGRLAKLGITRCNVFLYADNEAGASFWQHNGWSPRSELRVFQKPILVAPPRGAAPE